MIGQNENPNLSPAEALKPMSDPQRLLGIFVNPMRTFRDIAARPSWVVPLLILVIGTGLLTQWALPVILADAKPLIEQQFDKLQEQKKMSEEDAAQAAEMGWTFAKYTSAAFKGIGTGLYSLIVAAVLLFIGSIVLLGKSTFRHLFSVAVWTSLVSVLSFLIKVPLALHKGTMEVYLSPAMYLPQGSEKIVLFQIAAALDVFALWQVVLLAIGFSAAYRFSLGKALGTLGGLYVLLVGFSIIMQMLKPAG